MGQVKAFNSAGAVVDYDKELVFAHIVSVAGDIAKDSLTDFMARLEKKTGRNYACISGTSGKLHNVYDVSGEKYPHKQFEGTVQEVVGSFQAAGHLNGASVLVAIS